MGGIALRSGLALGLLFAAAAAWAQPSVYRWTDKDGNVHYGDSPGAAKAERVETQQPSGAGAPAEGSSSGADKAASASAADCKAKTEQLAGYKNAAGITETDALGNKREYTAEERQKLIDLTQKFVDERCAAAK